MRAVRIYLVLGFLLDRLADGEAFTVNEILQHLELHNAQYEVDRPETSLWPILKGESMCVALKFFGGQLNREGYIKNERGVSRIAVLRVEPYDNSPKPSVLREDIEEDVLKEDYTEWL